MEGKGFSTGSIGSTSAGPSVGGGSVGFESNAASIGNTQASAVSASVFESTVANESPEITTFDSVSNIEPANILEGQINRVESGILDAVRNEGTPEAGLRFISDMPVVSDESELSNAEALPQLSPEQKSVLDFQQANPEYLNSFGNVLRDPMAIKLMIIALKKAMEEEQTQDLRPNEEKEMSKKEMVFLFFLSMIQLATKAVEKGSEEITR